MRGLRAQLFMASARLSMAVSVLLMVFSLPWGARGILALVRVWAHYMRWSLRVLLGVDDRFVGLRNIPDGPCILAVKHQAEWETFVLHLLRRDLVFVLKKELLTIPVWGFYAKIAGNIGVDRTAGASALRKMAQDAKAAVEAGRSVVIFPEGTRTPPGESGRYHPGVAALYQSLGVPVVPVALNSGLYWPRGGRARGRGTIVVEFLPPIEPGLDRRAFMTRLQSDIETASARLLAAPPPPAA
jgi:1-acyl-sn-glycerol-3-phosphate acyltransferase